MIYFRPAIAHTGSLVTWLLRTVGFNDQVTLYETIKDQLSTGKIPSSPEYPGSEIPGQPGTPGEPGQPGEPGAGAGPSPGPGAGQPGQHASEELFTFVGVTRMSNFGHKMCNRVITRWQLTIVTTDYSILVNS